MKHEPPPSSVDLGLMKGAPAEPEKQVTLANWQDPPFNRWSFLHVRELIPTAPISKGDGEPSTFEEDPRQIDQVSFSADNRMWTVDEMLDETYTDGLLVLSDGRIVAERYVDGMGPQTTHLMMSVSKSVTATVAGALIEHGKLDASDAVTVYIPEMRGGPFEGCTVQHLLDMRAGLKWSEDYEDPAADVRIYEQVYLMRPATTPGLPADAYEYMAGLSENARPHGDRFDYRSVLTDVLGWVIERAGGESFAGLCSEYVWSKLGAQRDAEITVDRHGAAMEDGGMCCTLRDLGRFGQMQLDEGLAEGGRVVSPEWVRACHTPQPELLEAFAQAPDSAEFPGAMYHNKWWVLDPTRGLHTGFGIHGQQVMIDPPSRTVVAKFSTQPRAWDSALMKIQVQGSIAICDALRSGEI